MNIKRKKKIVVCRASKIVSQMTADKINNRLNTLGKKDDFEVVTVNGFPKLKELLQEEDIALFVIGLGRNGEGFEALKNLSLYKKLRTPVWVLSKAQSQYLEEAKKFTKHISPFDIKNGEFLAKLKELLEI